MSEQPDLSKDELLARIDTTWPALQTALGQLTAAQLTTIKDAAGWTVKDHVIHLAAWERSAVFLLQGRPRHEGLGIDEAVYLSGDIEEINTAVFERTKDLPAQEALVQLRDVHTEMMALLNKHSEADLFQPYRVYLPDEPGEDNDLPTINFIYGDTAAHFAEHLEWIQTLTAK